MNNIIGISGIHSVTSCQGVSGVSGIAGVTGKAGTSGPMGVYNTIGTHGMSGTSGPTGTLDFREDLMKKYQMRFKIEISSFSNGFLPIYKIIDNSGTEYEFAPKSITEAREEVDEYISVLITTIRQEKINNLINE